MLAKLSPEQRFQLLQTALAASIGGIIIGTVVLAAFDRVNGDELARWEAGAPRRQESLQLSRENNVLLRRLSVGCRRGRGR